MKNIFKIFKTDLNNIRKKRAAIVVIVALMILPSMYAWFNIIPSWDPYANTSDVAVAVVNNDKGAEVEGKSLNVGDEVIDSLKENEKLGWRFVSEAEALSGVEKGDYYATVIIPEDFSEKLSSVLDDVPEQPILDYYINEKINAIAPKVTGAGASGIVESIQSGFVKVANEAIFTAFNDIGIELETNQASIEKFRDAVYQVEKDLPEIETLLGQANTDLNRVEDAIGQVNEGVEKAEEVSREAEILSERLAEMIGKTDDAVRESIPVVKDSLGRAQTVIKEVPGITETMMSKGEDVDALLDDVVTGTEKIDTGIEALQNLSDLLIQSDENFKEDPKIERLIEQLNEDLERLEALKSDIEQMIATLEKGENLLPEAVEEIQQRAKVVEVETDSSIQKLTEQVESEGIYREEAASIVDELKEVSSEVSSLTRQLPEHANNSEQTIAVLRDTLVRIEEGQQALLKMISLSEEIQKSIDEGVLLDGAERVDQLEADLSSLKTSLLTATENVKEKQVVVEEALIYVSDKSIEIDKMITEMLRFIDEDLMPKYEEVHGKATDALTKGNEVLEKATTYFPKIYTLLEKVDDGIVKGKDGLSAADEVFPEAKEKVIDLAKSIRELEEKGDLSQVIKLLRNDPTAEGEFFSEPILLKEHELFPIPNYGSAMAPFFTAMSLWVGGLILVSSLIVDVPNKKQYKSYEAYFGRILTFWSIGLAQALIVTVGNMVLLKTFVTHKILFVLFGFLISLVFVTIIYTFVSVFGNTGKVIAIILLVMQLGASGGTFPIQMTPMFFQKIHAFLPFTHALGLFRESIGGVIWPVALKHIAWLIGYMGIFLLIGIKLKERINKSSDKFLEEARESEIIL